MTRIKMCGITRPDDARAAADAGADAVGLVFWQESPRAVSMEQACSIVRALPPFVTVVGVFVNQPALDIDRIARTVGLHMVQLHGDETLQEATMLGRSVLKAVVVDARFRASSLAGWPAGVTPLLDRFDPVRRGGTGQTVDWRVAAEAARVAPVVLAGGLTPETVGLAVRVAQPMAVDVSSGIERSPGVKDAERMRAFVSAVRRAERMETS